MGRSTSLPLLRLAGATALLLAAPLTLTACGGDGGNGGKKSEAKVGSTPAAAESSAAPESPIEAYPPEKVLEAGLEDFKVAKSVRVAGDFDDGGNPMRVDFRLGVDVADGTMQGSDKGRAVSTKLRSVGGKVYMSGDAGFWESMTGDKATGRLLGGRWVIVPAAETKDFKPFLGVRQFDEAMFKRFRKGLASGSGGLTEGHESLRGAPVFAIGPLAKKPVVYVAASGTPHLVRLQTSGLGGDVPDGGFDFTEYDAPLQIQAPADAIDIGKMGK
ncbi:hypothetical protein [Actinomadura gamaensis]|uniref:Lipoprotein n=1 Tax=Actinomadura gamaensis TaxID=1763541 RepID=A0ABV9TQJ5_9ACTN